MKAKSNRNQAKASPDLESNRNPGNPRSKPKAKASQPAEATEPEARHCTREARLAHPLQEGALYGDPGKEKRKKTMTQKNTSKVGLKENCLGGPIWISLGNRSKS